MTKAKPKTKDTGVTAQKAAAVKTEAKKAVKPVVEPPIVKAVPAVKEVAPEPIAEPKPVKASKWEPSVGEKCLFTNDQNEFVASVNSIDPLSVTMHIVENGCQCDRELSIESLKEYTITPLTRAEAFIRLSDAGI